jgi:flavin-dependent dehydrogenase
MYDAIVVGARCAGSPTAMLLARMGYRVLLVDRSSFPSDTISTHYIHIPGVRRLEQWGLLGQVQATNCPPVERIRFDYGAVTLEGSAAPAGTIAHGYAPRRTYLDKILVDAAADAGVEVREQFVVEQLVWRGDRVVGIRGRSRRGESSVAWAPIVVGADGKRSRVASWVGAYEYEATPARTYGYYGYWSGVDCPIADFTIRENRLVAAFPTNDGLTCVVVIGPTAEFRAFRADLERNFRAALEVAPSLARRIDAGHREEPIRGSAEMDGFYRVSHGNGWALAGDAGYHRDAITGYGIRDAFADAEELARAIADGLSGTAPMDVALARRERARYERTRPSYDLTNDLGRLASLEPARLALFRAIEGDEREIARFFGTIAGTVPVADFWSPENVARILSKRAAA